MPIPTINAVVAPLPDDFNIPHYDSVVVVAPSFIGEGLPFQNEIVPVSKVIHIFYYFIYVLIIFTLHFLLIFLNLFINSNTLKLGRCIIWKRCALDCVTQSQRKYGTTIYLFF